MKQDDLLNRISNEYRSILNYNLVGIYVHGSIAFGCFNWAKSDIDFIVVVKNLASLEQKKRLLDVLLELDSQAPPKGFEMSVVLEKYCANFIYPTPYELHFGSYIIPEFLENPLKVCETETELDEDLAAHFTVIKKVGFVLYGAPINNVFGDIPEAYYLDSIIKDVATAKEEIINRPVYTVLNLCRVYAFVKEKIVISKKQGGEWGLKNLNKKYRDFIVAILNNYSENEELNIKESEALDFAEYALDLIFKEFKEL